MPVQNVSISAPSPQRAERVPFPRHARAGATVRCKTVQDVSRLDATAMRALRLGGRLTVGTRTFSVELAGARGRPQYIVRLLTPGGPGHRAPALATEEGRPALADALAKRLANRHAQLADRAHQFGCDTKLADLCRAFAVSPDLNVPTFKDFLEKCADGTRLRYDGHDYDVHVEPGRHGMADATAILTPVGQRASPMAQLVQAVRNLFRRASAPLPVGSIERLLTGAVRTYYAGNGASGEPPSPAASRTRVKSALQAALIARVSFANAVPDLRDADLRDADLTGLDLTGAILRGANLRGAKLTNVSLKSADLTGANLENADLANAKLANARFCNANLTGASLYRAWLWGADLSDANMANANLMDADARGARLPRADLSGATLSSALFCEAEMTAAVLNRCHGTKPLFVGAQLHNADFTSAHLPGAFFSGADLTGASFGNATLHRGQFDRAQLGGADFRGANVAGAIFDRVDVGDGKCLGTLALQADARFSIEFDDADAALAQLRRDDGPLPYLPDSPGGRRVIRDYLLALANACASSTQRCAALRDWLMEHPQYDAEPVLHIVLRPYQEARRSSNHRPLAWPQVRPLLSGLMRDAIASLKDGTQPAWGRDNAGTVMQLIFLAERPDAPSSAAQWLAPLRQAYLATLPAALVRQAAALAEQDDEPYFPVVGDAGDYALLISPQHYAHLVRGEPPADNLPPTSWMQMYRLTAASQAGAGERNYTIDGIKEIGRDLKPWPLLARAYLASNQAKWHGQLLDVLPFAIDTDYRADFEAAIVDGVARRRLVEPEHQLALANCVSDVLTGDGADVRLTAEHLRALLAIMPGRQDDGACQAYFLTCLAAVLARLSSERFFGESGHSPFALRRYAAALHHEARHIAPGEQFAGPRDYTALLLGDQCTAVLSSLMLMSLSANRNEDFRAIFDSVWPSKWRVPAH